MRGFPFLLLLLAALLVAAALLSSRLEAGHVGECFCVYYGDVGPEEVRWLSRCDVAVLPPSLPRETVKELEEQGVEVFGYFSVATVGGWEPWAGMVSGDIVVDKSGTAWGEKIVDPCSEDWRHVAHWVVKYLAERGYTGVFLDNLDMVDRYPWMAPCIAELVADIKTWRPGMEVMVNRGFTLLPKVAGRIDYLLFEDFVTYYDPSTRTYHVFSPRDLEWEKNVLEKVLSLSAEKGFRVLLLAYAPPGDQGLLEAICREWRSWGHELPLYVAPGLLQQQGVCNPCR